MSKQAKCPACGSPISLDLYNKIIGIEQTKKAALLKIQSEVQAARAERAALKKAAAEQVRKAKKMAADAKREGKKFAKEALAKGIEKERKRANRLASAVKSRDEQIAELTKQLKSGSTPSLEGLDFEKVVLDQLVRAFPEDQFEHTGKGGDILQHVRVGAEVVGRIIFELKKTAGFQTSYLRQTEQAIRQRNATYGVLVPTRFPKGSEHFRAFGEILVVHPDGVIHLTAVLRQSMIGIHMAGKSGKKKVELGEQVLRILASSEFKNTFNQAISAAEGLRSQLQDEVQKHVKTWTDRQALQAKLYGSVMAIGEGLTAVAAGKGPETAKRRLADALAKPHLDVQMVALPADSRQLRNR